MKNQQEFNYELFLTGKYRLQTRGGIEVNEIKADLFDPIYKYRYEIKHDDIGLKRVNAKGEWYANSVNDFDLFMIPIEPIDETIPFDLDKFKSGEWDVVSTNTGEIAEFAKWLQSISAMGIIWNDECNEFEQHEFNLLRLKRKPISPFTHPHLYEVSDNEIEWYPIDKYYDHIEGDTFPHKSLFEKHFLLAYKHLRLKQQPLEITKEMMIEKFGTDNYKMV
jgi:hypothetical protein